MSIVSPTVIFFGFQMVNLFDQFKQLPCVKISIAEGNIRTAFRPYFLKIVQFQAWFRNYSTPFERASNFGLELIFCESWLVLLELRELIWPYQGYCPYWLCDYLIDVNIHTHCNIHTSYGTWYIHTYMVHTCNIDGYGSGWEERVSEGEIEWGWIRIRMLCSVVCI